MIPLSVCFFLIIQCLAHGIYGSHAPKVSELSDINGEKTIPGIKIVYNYKQIRADQSPQVEQREEDLAPYFNLITPTSSSTTTPQPTSEITKTEQITGEHGLVGTQAKVHHHHHHHHSKPNTTTTTMPSLPEKQENDSDQQTELPTENSSSKQVKPAYPLLPIVPPPPVLPKWVDLEELLKHHQHKHKEHPSKHHHISSHTKEPESATTASPIEIVPRSDTVGSKHHIHGHHHIPTITAHNSHVSSTTVKPVSIDIQTPSAEHHSENKHHLHRGHHKFNPDEIIYSPVSLTSTLPTVHLEKGVSPPPPPTLSPWFDGFGK